MPTKQEKHFMVWKSDIGDGFKLWAVVKKKKKKQPALSAADMERRTVPTALTSSLGLSHDDTRIFSFIKNKPPTFGKAQ